MIKRILEEIEYKIGNWFMISAHNKEEIPPEKLSEIKMEASEDNTSLIDFSSY